MCGKNEPRKVRPQQQSILELQSFQPVFEDNDHSVKTISLLLLNSRLVGPFWPNRWSFRGDAIGTRSIAGIHWRRGSSRREEFILVDHAEVLRLVEGTGSIGRDRRLKEISLIYHAKCFWLIERSARGVDNRDRMREGVNVTRHVDHRRLVRVAGSGLHGGVDDGGVRRRAA